jgi:AmmeMemoRadiSam system protein A
MDSESLSRPLIPLTAAERCELLWLARESIRLGLHGAALPVPRRLTPRLLQPGAAFVSLHIGDDLRGCVGTLLAAEALHVTVAQRARSAAFDDPRFAPLTETELAAVAIEISRLSRLRPARPADVRPAVHGVCVSAGPQHGVFLPQVAQRYGWDCPTLLRELCKKAGLPPDAWQWPESSLEIFEAEVFAETTDQRQ